MKKGDVQESDQNKNANNKVDELYNSWLERVVLSKTSSFTTVLRSSVQNIQYFHCQIAILRV